MTTNGVTGTGGSHGANTPSTGDVNGLEHAADDISANEGLGATNQANESSIDRLMQLLAADDASMSPGALVAMAQQRMSGLNAMLQTLLTRMNQSSATMEDIHALSDGIKNWEAAHKNDPAAQGSNPTEKFNLDSLTDPPVTTTDPATGKSVTLTWRQLVARDGIDFPQTAVYSLDTLHDVLDPLKDAAQAASDGQEQISLQLQELVSRRGQFTQLVSQLLSSERDTEHSILQNTH